MVIKPVLIIHPYDRSSLFLKRISKYLITNLPELINYYRIHPNEESNSEAIYLITNQDPKGLIIFFGHGRSDSLFGAKSDNYNALVSSNFRDENETYDYYNDRFIDETNIDIFNGKKVFCLSCNSNERIGKTAVEKGNARVFLGFGDIPTALTELGGLNYPMSNRFVTDIKTEIIYIIKNSLFQSIHRNTSFDLLVNNIRLYSNCRRVSFLINETRNRNRESILDYIYKFKNQIKIYGDGSVKLIE